MPRATNTDTTIRSAYEAFLERLRTNRPSHINPWHIADGYDFDERAEHVRRLLIATSDYVRVALDDIQVKANVNVDLKYIETLLSELTSDIVGTLEYAGDRARGVAA